MPLDQTGFSPIPSPPWHKPGAANLLLSIDGINTPRAVLTRVLLSLTIGGIMVLAYLIGAAA